MFRIAWKRRWKWRAYIQKTILLSIPMKVLYFQAGPLRIIYVWKLKDEWEAIMLKCNNSKCGYETKWGDRYKICPRCGFVMEPYKPKREKKEIYSFPIEDITEDINGNK